MKKILILFLTLILTSITAVSITGCQRPGLYTITFDSDGGSVVQNQYVETGNFVSVPNPPTKEDCFFVCWVDKSTDEVYDFNKKVTKNVNLKALWLSCVGLDNYFYQFYDMESFAIVSVFEKSIEEVYLPDVVAYLDREVFSNCYYLTKFITNKTSKLQVISYETFLDNYNLESIVIPKSMKLIEGHAFYGCNKLSKVFYGGTQAQWNTFKVFNEKQNEDETYTYTGIVEDGNEKLLNATIYFYSANQPTSSGNFWRYVNGEPTPW